MTKKIIGVIPARMGATRFPNKPLFPLNGMPMLGHVYHRSRLSNRFDKLVVATCDREIGDYISSIGGEFVMTSDLHERATDRTAEAVEIIEEQFHIKFDIVSMIQGDEPLLQPQMLVDVNEVLVKDDSISVSNLTSKILTIPEQEDPNEVKVVFDRENNALYFSREPIPSAKKYGGKMDRYRQLGIISFQREFLKLYSAMEQTPLEIYESCDMMRVLENGYKIKMVETLHQTIGVDTPEEAAKVEKLLLSDSITSLYEGI
ncbi:MAG: 3-deoxy-manno-octulosonate cytidylyltransferase [Flavobacteriales bacterium]|nr:3-deoxy-manno-octulosonate cytidylyltransferase [Flavobacteriales bacterium]